MTPCQEAQRLERELAECRATYALDTQWLRAENAALKDALRVRICQKFCSECWAPMSLAHAETCRHYAVEKAVMNASGEGRQPAPERHG